MTEFKATHTNLAGEVVEVVTLETHEESLSELLTAFTHFPKGAGYHFKGELDIVEDDDA